MEAALLSGPSLSTPGCFLAAVDLLYCLHKG